MAAPNADSNPSREREHREPAPFSAETALLPDLYRGLGHALPMGVFYKDKEGRFRFVNEWFCEWVGRAERDILGRTSQDLFGEEVAARMEAQDHGVLASDGLARSVETNLRIDGRVRHVEVFKNVLTRDGRPDGVFGVVWDVSERVAAEEELKGQRELWRTLVKNTPAAVAMFDTDMRYMAWSDRWLSDYRLGEQDLKGKSHYEVFPEIGEEWKAIHRRCLAGATESREEDPFPRADGSVDYVRWLAQPWFRTDQSVGGLIMFTEVITARLELETERRLSAFGLEHVNAAFLLVDREARIVRVNKAGCELLERPREEIIRMSLSEVNADFPREIWREHWEALKRAGHLQIQSRVNLPRGRGVPVEIDANFVEFESKEYSFIFLRDISERRHAEKKIRDREALLQTVTNEARVGLALIDADYRYQFVNPAYAEVLGLKTSDLAGQQVPDVLGPVFEDQIKPRADVALAGERVRYELHVPRRADGDQERYFDVTYEPRMGDRGRPGLLVMVTDITERVQAAREREEMERKFQEAQKLESLGVLAGGIAHDFNNLLAVMLGNVSLIKDELPSGGELHEWLTDAEDAAARAGDLCQQLLAYAGEGRVVLTQVDLSQLVRGMASLLKVSINKGVELDLQLDPALPPVLADATQLNQVIMNLVINASEAIGEQDGRITLITGRAPADGVDVDANESAVSRAPNGFVSLEVRDNGPGMDAATRARIFEPFFTSKFVGRGLGLAAVQGIVRGHNGTLQVHTEPGAGAAFKLFLPVAPGEAPAERERPAAPRNVPEGMLVLVVDDEEPVRQTVRRVLTNAGYQVLEAKDGVEGVAVFTQHRDEVRAVLLDLTMPHMSGVEAFRRLRLLRPEIPVLLMSGYNQRRAFKQFDGEGPSGFVQKPFTAGTLVHQVGEVLRAAGINDGP